METFKVIIHTNGDDKCVKNVVNYPIGKDQVLKAGFGVDPNNSQNAFDQFKAVSKFYNNQNKTPVFHYVTSFTTETAPDAETAMELTEKIFKPYTDNHLAVIGVHEKHRENSDYHAHTAMSPTNINDGSMMYGDNTTNCHLAQRMADVTGQPTKLIVRKENNEDWECPRVFVPSDDSD